MLRCTLVLMFLLTTLGCAATPVMQIVDRPCIFHLHNPNSNRILSNLFDCCMNGDETSCDIFNDLHEVR